MLDELAGSCGGRCLDAAAGIWSRGRGLWGASVGAVLPGPALPFGLQRSSEALVAELTNSSRS